MRNDTRRISLPRMSWKRGPSLLPPTLLNTFTATESIDTRPRFYTSPCYYLDNLAVDF